MEAAAVPESEPATSQPRLAQTIEIMDRFDWTEERLDILRRLYPTTPAVDLVDMIGCTDSTIHKKARELGIKRDPSFRVQDYSGRYAKDRGRYKKPKP